MNDRPKYNPKIHHRRSIRLKGYDYSQKGLYFVTLCVKDRECLFGEIIDGEMILNDAGAMVDKWYNELENKFPDIKCHEHIVMPNHFHCIIENIGIPVGADLCVCPERVCPERVCPERVCPERVCPERVCPERVCPERVCPERVCPERVCPIHVCPDNETSLQIDGAPMNDVDSSNDEKSGNTGPSLQSLIFGEHTGSPLWQLIQWFKTMSTNEYIRNVKANNWPRFNGKLWQRNYWEHIIRNEKSCLTIADYIINNPKNWDNDSINPKNKD